MYMRMYEVFSGNRVLAYCFMSNHIHVLLEVVPPPAEGLTDVELLRRLRANHTEAAVAEVAVELAEARKAVEDGLADETKVAAIHERFTYRMHDLSEFMKGFMQSYTQWHNTVHKRKGHLWEDRFKSVIVEDGVACRTMAAYIDLNPVRAGMVDDPAGYRWSSYGEAVGGGPKGGGKKAREGLVRACLCHEGVGFEVEKWAEISRIYRRVMGFALGSQVGRGLPDLGMAAMLLHRVRYFTDGAVIGGKAFVNEAFAAARERFGPRRKDGARKMRGAGAAAAGVLWSVRDLRV